MLPLGCSLQIPNRFIIHMRQCNDSMCTQLTRFPSLSCHGAENLEQDECTPHLRAVLSTTTREYTSITANWGIMFRDRKQENQSGKRPISGAQLRWRRAIAANISTGQISRLQVDSPIPRKCRLPSSHSWVGPSTHGSWPPPRGAECA
jgi:hypothetical protein